MTGLSGTPSVQKRRGLVRFVPVFLALGLLALAAFHPGLVVHAQVTDVQVEGDRITITHALGTTQVSGKPERIVVFDFGILDTLDHLGIDVVGLPKTNVPPYLSRFTDARYTHVGSLQEPDFEKINALRPDLIIISARQSRHYQDLSQIAPTVYMAVDYQDYWGSIQSNLRALGHIFGLSQQVEQELAALEASIQRVRELASGRTGLVILVTGGRANAYGPASRYGFIHDVLGIAPAERQIAASTHGQNISWEFIVLTDPDHLFVIDRDAVVSQGSGQPARDVVENALVRQTRVYKSGNITYLDPTYWYLSGGGLKSFAMMLEDVEDALQ